MSQRSRLRLFVLHVVILTLLITLFGRLWYMQVLAAGTYQTQAVHTQTRTVVLPAPRGEILDDFGRPLASNRAMLVVSVDRPQLDKQADKGVAVLHRLAATLHRPYKQVYDETRYCYEAHVDGCWPGDPLAPIPVLTLSNGAANTRLALMIEERQAQFPGVTADLEGVRYYPQDTTAAHLVGYVGAITAQDEKSGKYKGYQPFDKIGKAGLEAAYESALRGQTGTETLGVDITGHISGVVGQQQPVPGNDVILSLDSGVQGVLQQALADAIKNAPHSGQANPVHPKNAAGVVVDTRTGQIVAMASYPTFNANVLAQRPLSQKTYNALARNNGLLDLAVQGQFAPGSTFKMISASAAISEGLATWSGSYACPPYVDFNGTIKRNSESESFPPLSLMDAIKVSCDTVFYNFAKQEYARDYKRVVQEHKKPIETVVRMAKAFGLDSPTGVDLPGEASGMILGWAGKKQMGNYYHIQFCRGAYGYTANGVHHPPQRNRARRAADKQRCNHPDPGDTLLLPGDQANMDIGQGTVLATPLQMAMVYAAVANGGTVFSPRIAKAVVSPDGSHVVQRVRPTVRGHLPVSRTTVDNLLQSLYLVTQKPKGTGYEAFKGFPFRKVDVGGKTGTAQVSQHNDTSWFASVAGPPGQRPQFAAVVVVPEGGFGASVAAPAVRAIWDGIYGLDGHSAALPHGLPRALPKFNPDGTVATRAPGASHVLPKRRVTTKGSATPSPHSTTGALGLPPAEPPLGWRETLAARFAAGGGIA